MLVNKHEKEIKVLEPKDMPRPEKLEIHTGRILVMDDEEMIRKVTKQMLGRLGYDPDFAKDGNEAIELYQEAIESGKPFEAVILDLTVKEGLGGKDAVMKILEINPHPNADRLSLPTIDLGGEQQTVVCGASNLSVGAKIAFAPVGTELRDGYTGKMARLKKAKLANNL